MRRFIHEENLRHLRELLARTTSETQCQRIVNLIEEEEVNYRASVRDDARKTVELECADIARQRAGR